MKWTTDFEFSDIEMNDDKEKFKWICENENISHLKFIDCENFE